MIYSVAIMKDFDTWDTEKKSIDTATHKFYHPRDIWWCALGVNIGYEQDGTGTMYERPVLVLKGFSKQVCLIVPLTTSQKKNAYHIALGSIDNKSAAAIISQVRLVDTKRFINKIAVLDENKFEEIKEAIKAML